MAYEHFYQFYDHLMSDVNYNEYINIVKKYAKKKDLILDIACGTGNVLIELLKADYNISGLDISDEMLLVCKEKLLKANLTTNLYQDDMRNIQVLEYYNIIISFLDSINYLTSIKDINQTFSNINKALKEEGYFIFDVHSLENVNEVFDRFCYNEVEDDYSFLWNSFVNKKENYSSVFHELTFFLKTETNRYTKLREFHEQVVFTINIYKELLEKNNFLIEKIIENESNKIIFVAKKCST